MFKQPTAKVVAASTDGRTTIWTLELRYWRAIHAEFLTHRSFGRNAGSSRARPIAGVLKQVWSDPAGPLHWGVNQPGMQARAELSGWRLWLAPRLWKWTGRAVCAFAWAGMKLGLHKQVVNRMLEPWQFIDVVVTTTDWNNFFALRNHPDAQPEIKALAQAIARAMREAKTSSAVIARTVGNWHLPYIESDDWAGSQGNLDTLKKVSAARCARVSYRPFGSATKNLEEDLRLANQLLFANPSHMSPFEHQATPLHFNGRCANLNNWMSYRSEIENAPIHS